jgi:hypothetical protein
MGQWAKGELASVCSQLSAAWTPVRFECREIVLLARYGNDPFRVVHRVSLLPPPAPLAAPLPVAAAVAPVAAAAAAAAPMPTPSSMSVSWADMRGSIDVDAAPAFAAALADVAEPVVAARRDSALRQVQAPDSLAVALQPCFARVRDWALRVGDPAQLPKTRARLETALAPFLRVDVPVNVDSMIAWLTAEGYISIGAIAATPSKHAAKKPASESVTLPKQIADSKAKQPAMPHAHLEDSNADEAAATERARQRCVALLTMSGTKLATRRALVASITLTCRISKRVPASTMIDAMVEAGLIAFVDPPPPNYARALTRSQRHGDEEKRIEWRA